MKPGQASKTAEMVCMARALAHAEKLDPRFTDPAALALLGAPARARAERLLSRTMPRRPRALLEAVHLHSLSRGMVARTVAIDDAIRGATSTQLVILGAGLDGRAWRMPELAGAVVFEIDHPDTQREKQARAAELRRVASEVHFVPVDFERDDLAAALDKAGHDPSQPTTWVWEGRGHVPLAGGCRGDSGHHRAPVGPRQPARDLLSQPRADLA
ncbi:MAG TPA: class I SAM-dependent methyltransferase, partial [Kofleriaceae bacterium]|nr:class I SAM-dependent methyltransferase [Kofleriaceae bacterium]